MKKFICILLVALLLIPLVGCASQAEDDLQRIKKNGKLIIGITEYAPMNYYDEGGTLIGFDTEFAEAVCAKLGVKPEFVVINWDTKEVELKAKNIDCIWNGLTVTEERKENMAFSTPYIVNEQVVLVRSDDLSKYASKESLAGIAVVAETGSAGESAIEVDLADAKYTAVASQANALLEVKAGTAEAAVIDATMAYAMTGPGTDYSNIVVSEAIDLMDEEYAIGFRLESALVKKVNEITAGLLKDGTLKAIAEKYDLADRLIAG